MIERIEVAELARIKTAQKEKSKPKLEEITAGTNEPAVFGSAATDEKKVKRNKKKN